MTNKELFLYEISGNNITNYVVSHSDQLQKLTNHPDLDQKIFDNLEEIKIRNLGKTLIDATTLDRLKSSP